MNRRPWIAFFSQTGAEICDLAKCIGEWPDAIITNERPKSLRVIDARLKASEKLVVLPNKPEHQDYLDVLEYYKRPLVTLHGWLRIVPPYVCEQFEIYNGHPGLITDYPELKGKDPQIRAFEGKYKTAGAVLHRATAGVDEGKIVSVERFNAEGVELEELFRILRDRSLYMWCNFLENNL